MSDPLGDGISSVELLNHMGDDLMVVNAARVSFNKQSQWIIGNDRLILSDPDTRLIRYLASHGHWTPFSQPQLQFRIKMPLFVAREWYRHTVGFTRNEVSRRYVDTAPEFYIPTDWRLKPTDGRKQGSGTGVYEGSQMGEETRRLNYLTSTLYAWATQNADIAPEMARMILPQSMYTEFIETASLYAYSRLCKLRISPDAQQETRLYAEAVSELIAPLFPVSWKELRV